MAQLLRKTNLAKIFSESRSGTIAHKNKKRITAVTHYRYGKFSDYNTSNAIHTLFTIITGTVIGKITIPVMLS